MPNREQEVDDENDNSNYEPSELNEVLRSQHDMGGSEEGSEDMTSWCRSDMEGLGIEVSVDENIHLEDDLLSDNNETDIEEDDDDSTPMPKKGRGTLKGLKVAKKASETSDGKLSITFSRKFGGPIDINYRTFVDSVVVQVRQHLPLNVKNWKEIPDENKNILKAKVLEEAKEKIAEMKVNEDRTLSSSERDTIFQSVVSMSGSKSSSNSRYVLGRGYMAKLPTSTERVCNELNSEVQSMRSQLDAERTERVAERAEMEAKFEAECAKRVAEHAEMEVQFQRLRQTMREEFLAILANQS
nr:hypothetical protein CFP56_19858 [Quercus suber]